jgi:Uncharacterised nucleotidyltransferase
MTRRNIAGLVFQCLHSHPQRDAVETLAALRSGDLKRLLLHLDQTGLAVYLLHHLVEHNLYSVLAPQLQAELKRRLERNQTRADDMFREFSTVITAFQCAHVNYAVMKGFSLVPDYSPAVCLRHQTDIDLHIDSASIQDSRRVLEALGYKLESDDPSGEMKFVRQLGRPFTGMTDIYSLQSASRIELHQHFWETRFQVALDSNRDSLAARRFKRLRDLTFPTLGEEDVFIGQLLHAFRHFLKGWIRSSWLFEIASFVRTRFDDQDFWNRASNRVHSAKTAHACGFILLLCRQLLGMPIPDALEEAFVAALPPHLSLWVELFGCIWAASDMEGSKLNLLIHEHFVPDPDSWRKQHASLLIPRRTPSVSLESRAEGESSGDWRRRQARILFQRASFHLSRNAEYAFHNLRWRYALFALEKFKPQYA